MMIQWNRFNLYLLGSLGLAVLCGCRTEESRREKALSTIRIYLEVNPNSTDNKITVPIYRDKPVMLNVESTPFLTEADVVEAKVVDTVGGFAIGVRLARRGSWLLEQYTVANHGRRLAIFSQFASAPDPKLGIGRWLAAPVISKRISDGYLLFTPDASRDEAYQIVVGLNNVAKKNKNDQE